MVAFNYANPAIGAVVSADTTLSGHAPSQACDGSDLTYWQHTGSGGTHWLKVDLGAPQYIDTLRVLPYGSSTAASYGVEYCNDDATWLVAINGINQRSELNQPTEGITARYWRVYASVPAANTLKIYQFELWGPVEAPPPPENPVDDYITAWLDGIEANYVPTIQDWLDAH